MRRRGKTPRQGRAGAVSHERSRRGPEPARLCEGKPEARATDKGLQGSWGRRGDKEPPRSGWPSFPHSQTPGSLVIASCRDHAAAPPAAEPTCHGVPGIHLRGGRDALPALRARPVRPHLLVGRGEVLSNHGTGPLRLTRDHDATEGASSKKRPLL